MSSKFELNTALAFDEKQQLAILGWCLVNAQFCTQCMRAVKPEWFASPLVAKTYQALYKFVESYNRLPSTGEFAKSSAFAAEEVQIQQRMVTTVTEAHEAIKTYGLDMLKEQMTEWMHAVTFYQGVKRASDLYNTKKVTDAWNVMDDAALLRATSSFEDGLAQGFIDSSTRILTEKIERLKQAERILPYGVQFLDDALGGIIPNDLIVIGAPTGKGKSALASSIALANSSMGNRVHYFALEAEQDEIERRIKYGILSEAYYENAPPGGGVSLSYTDWRMGRLEKILGPIEARKEQELQARVANLSTLYRTSGVFDLKALEKNLLKVVDKTRLIIIDHLHYIDTGEDENYAYKQTIKLIRDIVLKFSVPIIVIAHLRKAQGGRKEHALISSIDDFHGTSDVPKIATTCIMLAPAYEQAATENWKWPTYMGAVKSRLDGSRTRYTGLLKFNSRKNRYENDYEIGKMSGHNTSFDPLSVEDAPAWSRPQEPVSSTSLEDALEDYDPENEINEYLCKTSL